ncbi:NERD domain-containing protein [Amycolatopsis thermoflava]|uniref:NERD domain-containing protein n=1 Tax=Amycolatopsis thermoflava TaxID=84480 RepID=UPI000480C766|nr:NERD domain-containing protein [Amycolatopsis thermoflava]
MRTARRPHGETLARFQQAALRQAAEAERRLLALVDRIRAVADGGDALRLYSSVTLLQRMRRTMPGHLGFGADAMAEFFGGLVTAMPVEQVLARHGAEPDLQSLWTLDALLREYAIAQMRIGEGKLVQEGASNQLDRARHLLEFENQFDRMLGYPAQLRVIYTSITDRLSDRSQSALGFALKDALIVADAYGEVLVERELAVAERLQPLLDQIPRKAPQDDLVEHLGRHLAGMATFASAPVEDLVELLTERTGIPRGQLSRLLGAMTTQLGSQPTFTSLFETNVLRRRPIIGLPDGRKLWASPGDFMHLALDWAADVCSQNLALLRAFDKRRQDACEELAHQALLEVFGAEHVHRSATYPADGQRPDVDVLVATPGGSIVVEAKAGRFTDPARRGAPERVRKKSREFIDKALDQNARTIRHLQQGAEDLRDKDKRPLTIPNAPHITSVIVMLDRVDPFATHLPDGGKRGDIPADGTWLVNLADLLMVADILRHPAEFYAYAELRARINKLGGPTILVETEALGLWCEKRIQAVRPGEGEVMTLSTTSQLMNDYYTRDSDDPDQPSSRPTSGVPAEVLEALTNVMEQRPGHWHSLTVEALSVPPTRWSPLVKALKTARAERQSRKGRKHVRRASTGLRLTDNLTVCIVDDNNARALGEERPDLLAISVSPPDGLRHPQDGA